MADAALGDFFSKKNKKKIKPTNLNNSASTAKPEEKKPGKKDAEEEGWGEEETVVAQTLKVEVAGKLMSTEEDTKGDDSAAPAWGTLKTKTAENVNDRKFPTLAKAVGASTNINLGNGDAPKINIQTSKNAFQALGNSDDEDDEAKRPTEIKPAMVQKKKGEFQKTAIQREMDKYKKDDKDLKKKKKKAEEEDEEDEEEEEEEAEEEEKEEKIVVDTKKKNKKKEEVEEKPAIKAVEEEEVQEDVKIVPDLVASKAKYAGRRKLPKVEIPREELEEEKENRPKPQPQGKKKKWMQMDEEDDKSKKLQYVED